MFRNKVSTQSPSVSWKARIFGRNERVGVGDVSCELTISGIGCPVCFMVGIGDTDAEMAVADTGEIFPYIADVNGWERCQGIDIAFCKFDVCSRLSDGAFFHAWWMCM